MIIGYLDPWGYFFQGSMYLFLCGILLGFYKETLRAQGSRVHVLYIFIHIYIYIHTYIHTYIYIIYTIYIYMLYA